MRRVPLVTAPLAFAAHAYPGQALLRFLTPVQMSWMLAQTSDLPHVVPFQIDPNAGRIVISRSDPTGARIDVDLVEGSVRLVLRRQHGRKRMQDTEMERGTMPFVLSRASAYPTISHLFDGLGNLWSHLRRALQDAHRATPRIVAVRGRRARERGVSLLPPEIWDREPAWDENAVYLPPSGPLRQGDAPTWERCGSVTVSYLGERRRLSAELSVERELKAFRLLLPEMNNAPFRDPPIAHQRFDEFYSRAREQVPQLRRTEFERAWIAATMLVRAMRRPRESRPTI